MPTPEITTPPSTIPSPEIVGPTLMQIGSMLMSAGADTDRVRRTIKRISEGFGYETELLITHKAIHLQMGHGNQFYHQLKRAFTYSNNLQVLSEISRMSWKIAEEGWSPEQIQHEVARIQAMPRYPVWFIITVVSLAGAAFCRLLGGDLPSMATSLAATLCGQLFYRQALGRNFNLYLSVFVAALFTTLVAAHMIASPIGASREHSLPASLLFLIPGIPLLNSFSDFIEGNLLNGLLRMINGMLIIFSIAIGFLTAMLLYAVD